MNKYVWSIYFVLGTEYKMVSKNLILHIHFEFYYLEEALFIHPSAWLGQGPAPEFASSLISLRNLYMYIHHTMEKSLFDVTPTPVLSSSFPP